MALNTYSTGTVSVTSGGAVAVAGGIWGGPNVVAGDMVSVDGGAALLINDVADATHGQLVGWSGGAVSGKVYVVYKCSSLRFDDVQMAEDAKDIVAAFNTEGFYHFVKPGATEPDSSLGDDGQYAFQATTGSLWVKSGGVWVSVGVYKGINPRGAWNSATAYAVNDVVSDIGNSYMATSPNTNDRPPSANWMTLGAAGADGGAITFPFKFRTAFLGTGGELVFPTSPQKDVAEIQVGHFAWNGAPTQLVMLSLADGTSATKYILRVSKKSNPAAYLIFNLSTVLYNESYTRLMVSGRASSADNPFVAGDDVILTLTRVGDKGDAATLSIGSVTTGAPGSAAAVSNSGDSHAAVFDITIPTGKGYGGTSVTSMTIGTGSKTFAIQAGLAFVIGDRVHIGAIGNELNWMEGFVTAYSGTSMTVAVGDVGGTGTFASWGIGLTGKPGLGDGDMKAANYASEYANDTPLARRNLGINLPDSLLTESYNDQLIEAFRGAYHSDELFTQPNGINEFDLLLVDEVYYFAFTDGTTTNLCSATTIAGLESASKTTIPDCRYPTILSESGVWHLWGWSTDAVTKHYTSSSFTGPYTLQDQLPPHVGDLAVRRHSNGLLYGGYKHATEKTCGIVIAQDTYGPWTDLGAVFEDAGRAPWHEGEEADAAVFEYAGKTYVTFAGWDTIDVSKNQLPAIVEIDPRTCKAVRPAVVLVNPTAPWQHRNSQFKLFNPVFLDEPGSPPRIYYSQNVSTSGVAAGWGYLEASAPPIDARRNQDLVRVNFASSSGATYDVATNIIPTIHGSATIDATGLLCGPATGGAFGRLNGAELDDFSIAVSFTVDDLPGEGEYFCIFKIRTNNDAATPIIGLWIGTIGGETHLHLQVTNNDNSSTAAGAGVVYLASGNRIDAIVTRRGDSVALHSNGYVDFAGTCTGRLTGLKEWCVGNSLGAVAADSPAGQQFSGYVHRILVVSGDLMVPNDL
ncbi:MAG: hypothetical protein WBA62_22045 [Xanthobacteraceae bacterium]